MGLAHHILNDGTALPAIGLGTYGLRGRGGSDAMASGLGEGYRLLDSAVNYENEGAMGHAVRSSRVAREEVRVTSKLPGRHHRKAVAILAIEESLLRTGLDYLDLYLIHWPNPSQSLYVDAWEALIEARERGLIRSIGVSNFLPEHLDRLIRETGVTPSVNQIELHPYFNQQAQRIANRARGVLTQAWAPIGKGEAVLNDPCVKSIARKHSRTSAQIVLRWHLQLGVMPIPKSGTAARRLENIQLDDFSLDDHDMNSIDQLSKDNGRLFDGNPATYEEF